MLHSPELDESGLVADTLAREVRRRRTFAIISHPDAGKTTLTEKLLLYAGAIELAGAVRGSKTQRHAVSDWMEMEQQRGISISAAALEFELDGHHVTLLDTPGHQDFSEDTYRTLLAVDSVVMVLDAAKGVEPQTLKLFEVCRARGLPVLTFINKLDQPARDPFELLDQIERVLGISAAPMNWPLGDGPDFRGVYDLEADAVLLLRAAARAAGGPSRSPSPAPTRPGGRASWSAPSASRQLIEAVEIITGAGTRFDRDAYRSARQTPVFFGSALNDFGVEPFLHALLTLAPSPAPRDDATRASSSRPIPNFSGFVFKIQANMNPRHRDRVAFLRICSGRLAKDMAVDQRAARHAAAAVARLPLLRPRSRDGARGVSGRRRRRRQPGPHRDRRHAVRRQARASFRRSRSSRPSSSRSCGPADVRHKRFDEAVAQLAEEGLHAGLHADHRRRATRSSASSARCSSTSSRRACRRSTASACTLDRLPHVAARWPVPITPDAPPVRLPTSGVMSVRDRRDRPVLLFQTDWHLRYTIDENPGIGFNELL